ncbi:MAG: hypothetical protein JWP56_2352 [Aeromicrobium sp.]|nr:hypothetical protein [Aeromicrobium sp.]
MSFLSLVGTARELAVGIRAGALAGLMVVVASLSSCIAPDLEVLPSRVPHDGLSEDFRSWMTT